LKRRSREINPPDITPLIDVVFLLLVFFMVSTVFKKDEMALLLNLPKVEKGNQQQKNEKNLMIELSSDKLAYNGTEISIDELKPKLETIKNKLIPIDLRVDKEVKYDRLVKLLNTFKMLELTNLSLITES